jgi:acyl-CoA reductase-like NAD-dependent aldehyde dehydrogenase
MFVNGEKKRSKDGKVMSIINPTNKEIISEVPHASSEDVEEL